MGDTPQLLVTYGSGGVDVIRSRVGVFQAHQVPMELEVLSGKTKIAEAKTIKLSTENIAPSLLQVTPDMTTFSGPVVSGQGEMRTMQVSGPPPAYPMQAKAQHLSGTVVFAAVIGKDGHVVSLKPVGQQPSPLLTQAAKSAVERWIYRPFEINGLPFDVETQVTVNFGIN